MPTPHLLSHANSCLWEDSLWLQGTLSAPGPKTNPSPPKALTVNIASMNRWKQTPKEMAWNGAESRNYNSLLLGCAKIAQPFFFPESFYIPLVLDTRETSIALAQGVGHCVLNWSLADACSPRYPQPHTLLGGGSPSRNMEGTQNWPLFPLLCSHQKGQWLASSLAHD